MNNPATFGPHNPHPLSQMKTELVWEGKYDEFGNRREVDIAGFAMPPQRVETIDEYCSRRARHSRPDLPRPPAIAGNCVFELKLSD
ncbi:MAG: hypothetical protein OXE44_17415 [Nitrospinae bacterium]|nr:hypothetical protein [Nitrospinota bacterium]